jgi:hypothetical protein
LFSLGNFVAVFPKAPATDCHPSATQRQHVPEIAPEAFALPYGRVSLAVGKSKKKSGKKKSCPETKGWGAFRVYRQTRAADIRAWPLHTSSSPPPHSIVRQA